MPDWLLNTEILLYYLINFISVTVIRSKVNFITYTIILLIINSQILGNIVEYLNNSDKWPPFITTSEK